jgi:hypothetical protein
MQRTETGSRGFSPVFNELQAIQGFGGQIDWSRVSDYFQSGRFIVKLNGAAAIGADSLTVDALEYALKQGDILRGADIPTVTVELSGNEAIGQTAISVVALSGALPNGAILYFGTGEFMKLTAAAAAGDTSLTVEALEVAVESGDTATFQGGEHNIEVLADAAVGATSVSIDNLKFALADNTELEADYTRSNDGKFLAVGTVMVKTSAGKLIPRRDYSSTLSDVKINEVLASDAWENSKSAAKTGFGTYSSGLFYENLMPDADVDGNLPSAYKTELEAVGFKFTDYSDNRIS